MRWLCILSMAAAVTPGATVAQADDYEATRWVMGTYLRVTIPLTQMVDAHSESADLMDTLDRATSAANRALDEVQRWESILSNYDPESPLSRLGQAAPAWVEISPSLHQYLLLSQRAAADTDNTFDITFASDQGTAGIDGLELRKVGTQYEARLARRGMRLDPGGNGKGVALDAAVEKIRDAGVFNAYLDFGGSSFYGLGRPAPGTAWKVEFPADSPTPHVFELTDAALSSSAALRADEDSPQDRQGHIVDPATGRLVQADREVAVLAPSAADAEVLSTALVVAGSDGFAWLAAFHGASAVLSEPTGELIHSSPVSSPSALSPLTWLVGTWERTANGTRFYERWHAPQNGIMHGEGGALDENGRPAQVFERLALLRMGDGVHYVAYPTQNEVPVAFKLVAEDDGRWTFENTGHDFPQRIAYVKDGADRMRVIVTGPDDDGQKKVLFFPFTRMGQNRSN